ncbi:MAG TPA: hypothetical protein VLJ39_07200 [Tepidisphaeraceae bacterium]|jgi:hypothetical protein|nr:hypothetical protein [Tepidisphaeraceae bacterium]
MELTFLYLPEFVREWDRLRLTDADLCALEDLIARGPALAPVMRGTGGLRKIRFAPPSRHTGKSGAMRVGFAYVRVRAAIIVVAVFSKNVAANFTAAERAAIAERLRRIERSMK